MISVIWRNGIGTTIRAQRETIAEALADYVNKPYIFGLEIYDHDGECVYDLPYVDPFHE